MMTFAVIFVPATVPMTEILSFICMFETVVVAPDFSILEPEVLTVYVVIAAVELACTVIVRLVELFMAETVPIIGRANPLFVEAVCAYAAPAMTRRPAMAIPVEILCMFFICIFKLSDNKVQLFYFV